MGVPDNAYTLIVLRYSGQGRHLAMSKPCQQCQSKMRLLYPEIRRVIYSVSSQDFLVHERSRSLVSFS